MKISYDCEELIEELKADIAEFGDADMYAFFEKVKGCTFLTDYILINKNEDKPPKNLIEDSIVQVMKASKILEILEKQNKIM